MDVRDMALAAREAALRMSGVTTDTKNRALRLGAAALRKGASGLLAANDVDMRRARSAGASESFLDRLLLNDARVEEMARSLEHLADLPDPVGEVLESWRVDSGLEIVKRRVPIGVIAIIYESRPNVTADAAGICLKSGNAVILRSGSEALGTCRHILSLLRDAACDAGLPDGCMAIVDDPSRETAARLMGLTGLVDALIPRGGKSLIRSVAENAKVPVIQTGDGVCHVYVDGACDREMGLRIAVSAKVSRPSVCNSAETLLVDSRIASEFLPECVRALRAAGVELRGCEETRRICPDVTAAVQEDWDTEYNALIYSVKVVSGVEEAIAHINAHGTRHSEAIITEDADAARRFLSGVDAAAVYWNASTRFTDGGEFGFGAEIGISNQKLHARGPMGLKELTTYKYEITGSGQIR